MLQKTTLTVLIIIGALFVLGLIIIRADLQKTSGQSNRKKRLIELGLSLLVFLGLGAWVPTCTANDKSGYVDVATGADTITVVTSDANRSVASTEEWARLVEIWDQATPIARGEKGWYPFNEAERRALLDGLNNAARDVNSFFKRGLLRYDECDLLNASILALIDDIKKFRPVEMKNATCYLPSSIMEPVSLKRLETRLPIISTMVETDTLQAAIVERIITSLELEVKKLEDETEKGGYRKPEFLAKVDSVVVETRDTVEKLKTILQKAEPTADN